MKYRDDASISNSEGDTTKNLQVIKNGYLTENILLIDNISANFADNVKNCAPIRPFNLQTMYDREFGIDTQGKPTYSFDLGLLRLETFIGTII